MGLLIYYWYAWYQPYLNANLSQIEKINIFIKFILVSDTVSRYGTDSGTVTSTKTCQNWRSSRALMCSFLLLKYLQYQNLEILHHPMTMYRRSPFCSFCWKRKWQILGLILFFTKKSSMTARRIRAVQVNEPRADSSGIGVEGLIAWCEEPSQQTQDVGTMMA